MIRPGRALQSRTGFQPVSIILNLETGETRCPIRQESRVGRMPDTASMLHRGKRSADLRIGTNRRFPANLAESEFGAPGAVPQNAPSRVPSPPFNLF
jgi:hypothetical protein